MNAVRFDLAGFLSVFALSVVFASSSSQLSAQGGATVTITFNNTSTRVLTINTGVAGQPLQAISQVRPGQTASVQSGPGQNWVLLNPNNRSYGEYRATNQPRQTYTVTQDGGFAGPAAPAGQKLPTLPQVPGKNPPPAPNRPVVAPVNPPAVAANGATGSKLTSQQAQQIINYHNLKRAEVGNGKIAWSPQIAQYAQQRADTIARTKKFAHLDQGQNPYGENLAQGGSSGGAGGYTVISACDDWYAEKAKMPNNARTFTIDLFNRGVGHYTQMVWKGSTQIGAGISQYQNGGFTWTVVVCCYSPVGNVLNQAIY